jgi:hypothetical protein
LKDNVGPRRYKISARNFDFYRTRAISGRTLSPEEIEEIMSKGPKSNQMGTPYPQGPQFPPPPPQGPQPAPLPPQGPVTR